MIELKHIYKSYPSPAGCEDLQVLIDVDLYMNAGESVAVMGPSGSGKSTLLNLMGTMDQPTSGEVLFEGSDISKLDEKQQCEFRATQVGFIFQDHRLMPQCTLMENILLPTLSRYSRAPESAIERAKELVNKVGLSARMSHYPAEISGGERQRVAVIRALINRPKLILADEPTGALDRDNAHGLMSMLCDLTRSEQCAVMVVTHDLEMAQYTQRQVKILNGKLSQAI